MTDARDSAGSLFDPFGVFAAIARAHMAWLLHPQELSELGAKLSTKLLALPEAVGECAAGDACRLPPVA